ncbi:unnamed protein product [Lepeophtheirus salmonis]|uniref:(salmon louse) hypothetical protein n=1 Tax=Lepeophtheirus salmonis TaxID=72036 RepID=A0A7R8H152_LEPSM|nr:unnamed protein product [Lepeophtheirus salmonis]CAF2782550.1 unnamed protein product [Lepeophtheirus salmonis]
MPKVLERAPKSLEDQCLRVYYDYLSDEMNLLFYLSFFKDKSILLKTYCRPVDSLFQSLECELSRLRGVLRDNGSKENGGPCHTVPSSQTSTIGDSLHFDSLNCFFLNDETTVLDFSINKDWPENDRIEEVARCLWKLIGEKCQNLEKLVIPKELCYSNSLNTIIVQGTYLKYLTLKRNVPTNLCLNLIGQSCPSLMELDIAGADIVTDFGGDMSSI